jgi:hypothetical protein
MPTNNEFLSAFRICVVEPIAKRKAKTFEFLASEKKISHLISLNG